MDVQQQAAQAVFVKSSVEESFAANASHVRGPTLASTATESIAMLGTVGYQATNFGKAVDVCNTILKGRTTGTSILTYLATAEAELTAAAGGSTTLIEEVSDKISALKKTLPPVVFLGVISTLFGTGVRESVTFLARHGLVDVIVVSGGAIEHDIRRAVRGCTYTTVPSNNSQKGSSPSSAEPSSRNITTQAARTSSCTGNFDGRFGNIVYEKNSNTAFNTVMASIIKDITAECNGKRAAQLSLDPQVGDPELIKTHTKKDERDVLDGLIPSWVITPSEFWRRVGQLLPKYLSQEECETSTVYWAAMKGIPIFCPSITDGDVMRYIFGEEEVSVRVDATSASSSSLSSSSPRPWPVRFANGRNHPSPLAATSPATSSAPPPPRRLQLDLVKDIYTLNRIAMQAHHTGIIVCGGGVIKHHICNANLFRNGAEHAVYINNAQEYDGSDGGARPDEAVSWGKIRATAKPVKIYAEITLVFPLLVAATFAQHVYEGKQNGSGKEGRTA